MSFAEIFKIDYRDPDLNKVRQLASEARGGRLVVFPTESSYAVGAPMGAPGAVQKLRSLTGVPDSFQLIHCIGEWEMLDQLQVVQSPVFRHISRKFWPGALVIAAQNSKGEVIRLHFPRNRVTAAFINAAGVPVTALSASHYGKPSSYSAAEALASLGDGDYAVIDGGPTELSQDATVVDLSVPVAAVLHDGFAAAEIKKELHEVLGGNFMRKKILIVCTGNSCRSPMAEGLLLDALKKKDLASQIGVSSCGIAARIGGKATTEAILVMKNLEIDISNHRSKPCTREDVNDSDLILCMAKEHADFITNLMPQARPKIRVMNVVDPIGMNMLIYEAVLSDIEKKFKTIWNDIIA